jgi:hypothetical protein
MRSQLYTLWTKMMDKYKKEIFPLCLVEGRQN